MINKDDETENDYEKIEGKSRLEATSLKGMTIVKTKEQDSKIKKKERMKKDVMTNFSKQLIEKHMKSVVDFLTEKPVFRYRI